MAAVQGGERLLESLPLALENLLSPAVLFFALGAAAALVRSDLHVPPEVTAGLAIYLMTSIGFRGGVELAHAGLTSRALGAAAAATALGIAIPVIAFFILTRVGRIDPTNAGAIAAHYGSISAVTFVTATGFLSHAGVPHGGYVVALMALMEAPGIITGILLARAFARGHAAGGDCRPTDGISEVLREAVFGGSVMVLLGSFAVGLITGERGLPALKPFLVDLFPGALVLFLLDMGLTAARRLGEFLRLGRFLVAFGLVMPVIGGGLGLAAAAVVGLPAGDATLLAALAASASYIAAPAAVRLALPAANPSLSITLALGITFPFNILLGIPLYYAVARAFLAP